MNKSFEDYREAYKIALIQEIADELGVEYPERPWVNE